ncbi:MAG: iron-sulfur cluster assembly scaffold protein [Patescibacteria group bacterium]
MDLYAENILDHFKHPCNKGVLVNPTVEHKEVNLSCGDELTIQLIIIDDFIRELRWEGTGCAISIGAMSILSEELIGKSLEEASSFSIDDVKKLLGVPISQRRLKCAMLGLHTLKNALHAMNQEPSQGWGTAIANEELAS